MEINDAIKKVKSKIQENKLAAKKKKEDETRKEREEEKESHQQNQHQLRQVKNKWFSKREELIKDKELMDGIKFLEGKGEHFRLCSGSRWAVYFCADGKFKMQRWGMYRGNEFIRSITLENVAFIDKKDIEKIVNMDFKEELKKQILKLSTKKYDLLQF